MAGPASPSTPQDAPKTTTTMASAFAVPFAVLCLATTALELFSFLNQQQPGGGGRTTTPAQQASLLLHSAAEVMPPLAAAAALFSSFAFIHHRLSNAHAAAPAAGGAGNRRLPVPGLVFFVLCVSAGTLVSILFVQDDARGAQALRVLGQAALRALPAAATAAFFLGVTTLFVVAHVRAGREGGGGAAVAGDGPIQGPRVRLLNKVALGVAAALAFLMVVAALYGSGAK